MEDSRFFDLAERLCALMRSEWRRVDTGGLLPAHAEALRYLAHCNRFSNTPSALAKYFQTTKGTVSQTVNALEKNGYLTRSADPDDGRVTRLKLTGAGKALARRLSKLPSWKEALDDVDKDDLAITQRVMAQVLRGLQKSHGYTPFGLCLDCRHLLKEKGGAYRCQLTNERLAKHETGQICHEQGRKSGVGG